jgi:hypothetical protein
MANRRSTRKNRGNTGFFGRLYTPINHSLLAVENAGNEVTNTVGNVGKKLSKTVGNVFGRTVKGVRSVGNRVTYHANQGVGGLVSGTRRKNRKNRSNRNRSNRNRSNRNRSNRNRRN